MLCKMKCNPNQKRMKKEGRKEGNKVFVLLETTCNRYTH
jgi:hypothetical protein